ncbi:MAG TPA: hydroxyacylglutathione hydrolase [Chlamydiales bacterium]|nr:hydroxyacylglutathione hydrolase [Chlamydiales bacterium]
MSIKVVRALSDNYIYLIEAKRGSICIDPGDAKPVIEALEGDLIAILNTHHHADHIGGNLELKAKYHCPLIAPNDERIEGVDLIASENTPVIIDEYRFDVLFVPGHTRTHVAYYCRQLKAVFTGDSLFTCGCGRIFEGTPAEMLHSLKKIAELPDETLVYSGHDYTQQNIAFALSLEPNNEELKKRIYAAAPWTVGEEKKFNPFLRTADPNICKAVDMEGSSAARFSEEAVFSTLRLRKNAC